jgi:hypothetical protein
MANPPITIGPFANVPAPGSGIRSDWAQQISTWVDGMQLPNTLGGQAHPYGRLQIVTGQVAVVLDANGNVAVAFPGAPFVNVVSVVATNTKFPVVHVVSAVSLTLSGFTLAVNRLDTGAPAASEACQATYIAIGRR